MPTMDDTTVLCDERGCPARANCFRYRARPTKIQVYGTFAVDGSCSDRIPVTVTMVSRGVLIDAKLADMVHDRADLARKLFNIRESA